MQLAVATLSRFEVVPVDGEVVTASAIEYEDSTVRYVCSLIGYAGCFSSRISRRPSNLRCQFKPRPTYHPITNRN